MVSQKMGGHVPRCWYGVISYKFIPVGLTLFLSRVALIDAYVVRAAFGHEPTDGPRTWESGLVC